jgi:peptidoglycan/xylan/chitin deacetylase (PgdA/CDA1 family)
MKNNKVTIVMYHYVRDLKHSRFPGIKGLDISLFKEQVEYLNKNYHIISMELLIGAIENKAQLPEKSALLTFDDAYIDHYLYVFPILNKMKLQGSFFPPVKAVTEHIVLDVNKIHFILATAMNSEKLVSEIFISINKHKDEFDLNTPEYYYNKLAVANRFDTKETIFAKRLLQVELEIDARKKITNELFEKYVGVDENSFSRELYMDIEQIKCMKRNGMHIGSHGYDHYWLNSLTIENQASEIDRSLVFIKEIGGDITNWTMCYPYGAYNQDTIKILTNKNCKLAVTAKPDIANISENNKFELPRLDTNDLPKDKNSLVNEWFHKS